MPKDYTFVNQLPGLVIAKDVHSTYLNISDEFAKLLGWKSADECSGKTDYDIPCSASEFADDFILMDKLVIDKAKTMLAIDIQNYSSGWGMVLVQRNPVINPFQQVEGLLNQCINVTDTALYKECLTLHLFDNTILNRPNKPASYILSREHCPLTLTPQEELLLFLLIRKKEITQIANFFQESASTAQRKVDLLKQRMDCDSLPQLIEKAIDSGFFYYIPPDFLNEKLENIITI